MDQQPFVVSESKHMSDASMDVDPVCSTSVTIQALPPELVASIFLFLRHDSSPGLCELHSGSPTQHVPFILSHVSAYFRAVALSLPELWDGLLINPGMLSVLRDPAALLHHSLSMASAQGRRGVHFSWRVSIIRTNPIHMAVLQNLFTVLMAYSPSWQSAELEVSPEIAPRLTQLRGHVPKLEELSIACYNTAVRYIEGFEDAAALTHVGIMGMGEGTRFLFPHDGVRWFVDRRLASLGEEVRDMSNLERLESAVFSTFPGEGLSLPHVASMVVCDTAFRGELCTPALSELTIRPNRMGETELSGVLRTVESSGCSLHVLSVTPDAFLGPLLDLSSSLEELNLTFSSWQDDQACMVKSIFGRMAREPAFLPHLARISVNRCDRPTIGGEGPSCFLGDEFLGMLIQRMTVLETVVVDVWGTVKADCIAEDKLEQLRALRRHGLDLCLRANDFGSTRRFV